MAANLGSTGGWGVRVSVPEAVSGRYQGRGGEGGGAKQAAHSLLSFLSGEFEEGDRTLSKILLFTTLSAAMSSSDAPAGVPAHLLVRLAE